MKEDEATQSANLKVLPALLLPKDLDKDEISLIENIKEDLKISEEAKAYQHLIKKMITPMMSCPK